MRLVDHVACLFIWQSARKVREMTWVRHPVGPRSFPSLWHLITNFSVSKSPEYVEKCCSVVTFHFKLDSIGWSWISLFSQCLKVFLVTFDSKLAPLSLCRTAS